MRCLRNSPKPQNPMLSDLISIIINLTKIMIDTEYYFQHCRWDNPCFQMGMFWFGVFLFTGAITLHYKIQDLAEAKAKVEADKQAKEKKASEASAQASAATQEPAVIKEEKVEEDGVVAAAAVSEPSKQEESQVKAEIQEVVSEQEEEEQVTDQTKEESKTQIR